ncbi:MAG TPA: DoxX-like family protein [Puia sp.]|nr:DoxX-like family protein [Puia sp.]
MLSPRPTLNLRTLLTAAIASVWLINGLLCKVLDLVPRHRLIVARILGETHAALATRAIGLLEIGMFIWILSGIRPRWCAWTQILLVAAMNIMEFILVPDLLLFGRINIIIAFIFIGVIFINEYTQKSSVRRGSVF